MPAKNPRVMVVMEKPLYRLIVKKAANDGVSLSTEMRDLARQALGEYEDDFWAQAADKRLSGNKKRRLISHKAFWKRVGI